MNYKVIYACITGGHDNLKQPLVLYSDFDYICFSHGIYTERVGVWEIHPIQ